VVWTAQEQRDLEAAMTRFPEARYPPLERYLRIAASLPQKVGRRINACCAPWRSVHATQRSVHAMQRRHESNPCALRITPP